MTTDLGPSLAARDSASPAGQHQAAIAARLAEHGITGRVTRLGGTPVLTIDEPDGGPDRATIAVDPDTSSDSGLRLDCTCLWTPAPGAPAEATADTIATVLKAIRSGREPGTR